MEESSRARRVCALLLGQVTDVVQHHRVSVVPVVDLAGDPAVDGYEIPAGLARHVRARDGFSGFPFSTARASTDLDHTAAWRAGGPSGQTRASNLAPLSRAEHRAKTFGGWRARQPAPGILEWVSPLGFCYRVRGGRTTRIARGRLLPWDPTGHAHYYPPPDDLHIDFTDFHPHRE